ncbi:maleylpyruvate isomerase family mycothiol-dependent enzyme [Agrobacterium leguminum]|uniref:Maleylpyruvate isomerase family mycothiol-dependent enzyme n=1 Tax=Agrobacterium leguminum TaxID=2792015 RepID=A0A9X3KJE8_9HYPH|nr:maleylpyruvate isomerase family mycothiol-dependent enzyme [Agrobacterium leguminum]MCZ7912629.1 maleylpyruvate isomerase family mycothiol-dependent enzyme [Agrobacterium leguminum]
MSSDLTDARLELRQRLGAGARYDSSAAPAAELRYARLGTAYFARKLNELSDGELALPSLVPGWTRRHVIAHVGFQARALARLVEAARLGRRREMLEEPEAQNEDIAFGASLPAHALRYLFKHSQVHLDVEWRDLDGAGWRAQVEPLNGGLVEIAQTPWLRTREIWLCAVDLDNGASLLDVPSEVVDRLLREAARALNMPGQPFSLMLKPTDRVGSIVIGSGKNSVSGPAVDLLRWLMGRGLRRSLVFNGEIADPPFWPEKP